MTKVAISPGDHPWQNKEAFGIMEYVSEHNHPHDVPLSLTVGISRDIDPLVHCEYECDEDYFDQSFELMLCVGRGEFIPETAGEFLGTYEPPRVKQTYGETKETHQVTMKGIKSAIANVLIGPKTEQIVDPNKGVINCLKAKQINKMDLIIGQDFPQEDKRKIAIYAEADGVEVEFKSIKDMSYDKETYVGSQVTSMLSQFTRASGWELNPYHRDAIPHLEGAAQVEGRIHMRYREYGVYREFWDEPDYFRYHPFQFPYLAAQMRIKRRHLSCFFFCSSEPLREAQPFNYIELGGPDQRYLPMICAYNGKRAVYDVQEVNSVTNEERTVRMCLDDNGNDLFFSRRARIIGARVPLFKEVIEVKRQFPGYKVGVVTSTCFQPQEVEEHVSDHNILLVESKDVRKGDMCKDDGHLAYVVLKSEEIRDCISSSPVMLVPGKSFSLRRAKVKYWLAQSEEERCEWQGFVVNDLMIARSSAADLQAKVLGGVTREHDGFYWTKSSECCVGCLIVAHDRYGEVQEFCCDEHMCDVVQVVRGMFVGSFDDYFAVVKNSVRVEEDYRNEYLLEPLIIDDERDGEYALIDNT
jgi:hypothetical protein